MEKYIYIGLIVTLFSLVTWMWFHGKKEKIKEEIRRVMVVARIWLYTEEGQNKEAWVIKKIIDSISLLPNAPITKKILSIYLTENRIKKIINKLVPEVKLEIKPVMEKTINTIAKVAVETASTKIINLGIEKTGDILKSELPTSEIISLAKTLKTTDKDTGIVSAIASYKTDFEKEKEFIGTIGFAKKF